MVYCLLLFLASNIGGRKLHIEDDIQAEPSRKISYHTLLHKKEKRLRVCVYTRVKNKTCAIHEIYLCA